MKPTVASSICLAGILFLSSPAFAQEPQQEEQTSPVATEAKPADPASPPSSATATTADPAAPMKIDKRVFGVLPNYRTADGTAAYEPIPAKRKLWIGFKDSFDYPVYFTSGVFAGINMIMAKSPTFGEGAKGYAKIYAASYADQAIGNMMTESFFPVMFKQDPRYFRVGAAYGGVGKRIGYALTRVIICRSDKGANAFNFSEWGGNSAAVAISNAYYPDNRNWSDATEKLGIQVGTDAISNVLKEFWPDIKQRFFKKKPAGD